MGLDTVKLTVPLPNPPYYPPQMGNKKNPIHLDSYSVCYRFPATAVARLLPFLFLDVEDVFEIHRGTDPFRSTGRGRAGFGVR